MPANARKISRPTAAPGKTVTRQTAPAPARHLRLSRTLANLAEHPAAKTQHQPDEETWPDLPEELHPIEEDALDGDDFVAAGRLVDARIVYSRAEPFEPPRGALCLDASPMAGELRATVRAGASDWSDDPFTDAIVNEELVRVAAALDHLQAAALRAESRRGTCTPNWSR